jgi:TolB-like protein
VSPSQGTAVKIQKRGRLGLLRLGALSIISLLLPLPAHPQDSEVQALASKTAEALTESKQLNVAVFDFTGPGGKLNSLGRDLADEFALALRAADPKLIVVDRGIIQKLFEKNRVAPDVVRDRDVSSWLSRQLRVDAFIQGQLSTSEDRLKITVDPVSVQDGRWIAEFSQTAPITEAMKARLAVSLLVSHQLTTDQIILDKGKMPACKRCPDPIFLVPNVADVTERTVVLIALVGSDGRARDIEIVRPLPHGLTEKAIETAQAWIFTPGRTAEGQVAEVETPIEVTFKSSK